MKKLLFALLILTLLLVCIPACGGADSAEETTVLPEGTTVTEATVSTDGASDTVTTVPVTTVAMTTAPAITDVITTEAPVTEPTTAEVITTEAPVTEPTTTEVSTTEAPVTAPVTTEPDATDPPVTEGCHHYFATEIRDATCTEDGVMITACTLCGTVAVSEILPAAGHSPVTTTTAATCTASGQKVTACSTCGTVTKTETIPAAGHSYDATTTAATCTKAGKTTYTCSACGDSYSETIAAKGHSYDASGVCTACGASNGAANPVPSTYTIHSGTNKFSYDTAWHASYTNMSLNDASNLPSGWSGTQYFLDGTTPYTWFLTYSSAVWVNEIRVYDTGLVATTASDLAGVGVYHSDSTDDWTKINCTVKKNGEYWIFVFDKAVQAKNFMLHMKDPSANIHGKWLPGYFDGIYDPQGGSNDSAVTDPAVTTPPETDPPVITPTEVLNYDDFKAMWLSQFDLNAIYTQNGSQRSRDSFITEIRKVLTNTKAQGINTVIVQVRPYADSMYPSAYYPMCTYVTGKYGREATYDPFAIVVEEAHALGLSVHAWINPMRAMLDSEITLIDSRYAIRAWYNDSATNGTYVVKVGSRWYLNPAYADVRQLIIDGAREILEHYDVDGLHMDDYFYPTTDGSFDATAYNAYRAGGGTKSLADWRREQLNVLVKGLYDMTKSVNDDLLFGISPAGNYNTVYDNQYADVYTWCGTAGYIDYICPQIYFGLEHGSYDFVKVALAYQAMIKTDSVKLIVGMSLGKAFDAYSGGEDTWAGSGKREWINNSDVLKRELEYTVNLDKCGGVAIFCYQYFYDPKTGVEVAATQTERDNFVPILKSISWQ